MIVKNLKLTNFRNYQFLNIDFARGVNYIVGDNAKGKTNLIEAIYALSFGKSFKTSNNIELINKDSIMATIKADVVFDDYQKTIEIKISKEGKKILVNSKAINKLSEINDIINVLSFVPKDTNLLKDSPKLRRNFMNATLSKNDKQYLTNLINYEKLLKERNEALRAPILNKDLLNVLTLQMARYAKEIYISRSNLVDALNNVLSTVYNKISLNQESLRIKYLKLIKDSDDYERKFVELFDKSYETDLRRKSTTTGIQREDFQLFLGDRNLALYGSQGENRMAVIALKLAPYFLIKDERKLPVIILDDVLSELDKKREQALLNFLNDLNQVFITNTKTSEYCKGVYYLCDKNTTELIDVEKLKLE